MNKMLKEYFCKIPAIFFILLVVFSLLAILINPRIDVSIVDIKYNVGHSYSGILSVEHTIYSQWIQKFYKSADALFLAKSILLEDGKPIGMQLWQPYDVREKGGGRYYCVQSSVEFSTEDGVSPLINNRTYSVSIELVPKIRLYIFFFFSVFASMLYFFIKRKKQENLVWHEKRSVVYYFGLIFSVTVLIWAFWRCRYGFTSMDESTFYLWFLNPWTEQFPTSLVGFLYHPLFVIMRYNIVYFRWVNLLFSFLIIFCIYYNVFWITARKIIGYQRVGLSFCFSCISSSMLYYSVGYYYSIHQAALLAGLAAVLLFRKNTKLLSLAWMIGAFSFFYAFVSRPQGALVLAIILLIHAVIMHKFTIKYLVLAFLTFIVLLCILVYIMQGNINMYEFYNSRKAAYEFTLAFGEHNNLFRIDNFYFNQYEKLVFAGMLLLTFCGNFFSHYKRTGDKTVFYVLCLLPVIIFILIFFNFISIDINSIYYRAVCIISILCSTVLAVLVMTNSPQLKPVISIVTVFCLLPFVTVSGSGQHFWGLLNEGCVFWIIASVVLLGCIVKKITQNVDLFMPTLLYAGLFLFIFIGRGTAPLETIKEYSRPVRILGGTIYLPRAQAEYIHDLRTLAKQAGMKHGDYLINLTGYYKLPALVTETIMPGTALMHAGATGSVEYSRAMLRLVDSKILHSAWVLDEPNGSVRLRLDLAEFGIDLSSYSSFGPVWTPDAVNYGNTAQYLLRPPLTE
jgi:hypothetical protein